MVTAHLIVHLDDVVREAKIDERAQKALDHINSLDSNYVYSIPHGTDPRKIPQELLIGYNEGKFDQVKIHGAYYGLCLNATQIELVCNGVSSDFSKRGIIYTQ